MMSGICLKTLHWGWGREEEGKKGKRIDFLKKLLINWVISICEFIILFFLLLSLKTSIIKCFKNKEKLLVNY